MKTAHKQVLALVLALILLLSLCACAQKTQPESDEPKMSTDKVDLPTKPDKKTPERQPEEAMPQSDMSNRTSRDEASDTQPVQYGFSQEAEPQHFRKHHLGTAQEFLRWQSASAVQTLPRL